MGGSFLVSVRHAVRNKIVTASGGGSSFAEIYLAELWFVQPFLLCNTAEPSVPHVSTRAQRDWETESHCGKDRAPNIVRSTGDP
jgi:hypothetical protein